MVCNGIRGGREVKIVKKKSVIVSIALLLATLAAVCVAWLQTSNNSAVTATSFFMQRTTSWTVTAANMTLIRICGNTPWNDSILAHCTDIPQGTPIPEFTDDIPLAFALLAGSLLLLRWGHMGDKPGPPKQG